MVEYGHESMRKETEAPGGKPGFCRSADIGPGVEDILCLRQASWKVVKVGYHSADSTTDLCIC